MMPGSHQTRTVEEIYEDVCGRLEGVEHHGEYATAFCPAHPNTDTPALSVIKKPDGVTFKCHGQDCTRAAICEAIGIKEQDLYTDAPGAKVYQFERKGDKSETEIGCTVEQYATEKGLPADWLKSRFGLRDLKKHPRTGEPAVVIPYFDESGEEARTRYRLALRKPAEGPDPRFSWKTGSKADLLYGIEDLEKIKENGKAAILVEGESDRHTLVYHKFPALGVPGAQNLKSVRLEDFEGIERIYAVIEPGEAGERFGEKLGELFKDRLRLVKLGEYEDSSGLHLDDPGKFEERFRAALSEAVSYSEQQKKGSEAAAAKMWETCRELAESEDILAEFARDIKEAGVVGQEREAKILYLAATSRYLSMPSSIIVKGPSGGGKSFVLNKVLDFHPEEAYYKLSAMSDKALAHFDQPLKHRHLVIAEAAALNNSEMAEYLVRTLLSEGYLHYVYPLATNEGVELHEVYVEGPTGLFITTTQQSVHQENETRLLSLTIDDTKAQTRAVILGLTGEEATGPNLTRWHVLQRWMALAGEKRVVIPYARWVADWIPEAALGVRLRRDFTQVLNLIRSHALLHQANRERDEEGRVVATCEDYRAIRALLYDIIAEGLEASVPKTVRETVEAVRDLYDELESKSDGVTVAALKKDLNLDRSAAQRRIGTALKRGFVKNLEEKKGKPGRYAPADLLPDDVVVLPEAEELVASGMCRCARCARGSRGGSEHATSENPLINSTAHLHTPNSHLHSPVDNNGVCSETPPDPCAQRAHLHTPEENEEESIEWL